MLQAFAFKKVQSKVVGTPTFVTYIKYEPIEADDQVSHHSICHSERGLPVVIGEE